jgi:DNA-binding NarL/FixJ family response regulator
MQMDSCGVEDNRTLLQSTKTRLLVVDDHPLFRQGIGALIATTTDLDLVAEAGTLEDACEQAVRAEIDVAIVDVLMPTVSGIRITRELRTVWPSCRVLGLSVVEEPCVIAEMLKAGAFGFAMKTEPPAKILQAIRDTANGVRYLPHHVSEDAIAHANPRSLEDAHLTKREREILELTIRGYSNTEIGSRLFIARRTVETHRHRIAKKLSTRSIVELQRIGALYGLLKT